MQELNSITWTLVEDQFTEDAAWLTVMMEKHYQACGAGCRFYQGGKLSRRAYIALLD